MLSYYVKYYTLYHFILSFKPFFAKEAQSHFSPDVCHYRLRPVILLTQRTWRCSMLLGASVAMVTVMIRSMGQNQREMGRAFCFSCHDRLLRALSEPSCSKCSLKHWCPLSDSVAKDSLLVVFRCYSICLLLFFSVELKTTISKKKRLLKMLNPCSLSGIIICKGCQYSVCKLHLLYFCFYYEIFCLISTSCAVYVSLCVIKRGSGYLYFLTPCNLLSDDKESTKTTLGKLLWERAGQYCLNFVHNLFVLGLNNASIIVPPFLFFFFLLF